MKFIHKQLALVLALALIFALTGCGASASEAVCMKPLKTFTETEVDGDTLPDSAAESGESAEEAEGFDPAIEEPAAEETGTADATEANTSSPSSTQPKKPAFGKKPTQTSAPAGTQPQPPAESGHQPSQPQNNGGTQSGSSGNTQSGSQPSQPQNNGGSQSGSSGNTQSGSQPQKHEHYWNPVYDTVHHEEKGHYENVEVQTAWDEPQYEYWEVCSACGAKFHGALEVVDHIDDVHDGHGAYSTKQFVSGYTHHDAVYEKQWVVDQSAWDEQVITGYECICGEKKSA